MDSSINSISKLPTLTSDDVHIWEVDLDVSDISKVFDNILSKEEKDRAGNLKFEKHRRRWVNSRVALRTVLGHYLGIPPLDPVFSFTKYGKPFLNSKNIQFNISHSGAYALLAFKKAGDIGVDIEYMNNKIKVERLVTRFFSKSEIDVVLSFEAGERIDAFFKCWTRKEAFIKAHGQGLSLPLHDFSVSIMDAIAPKIEHIGWDLTDSENWNLNPLSVPDNYKAALVTSGSIGKIIYVDYNKLFK